ncbi:MAG: hypothetical protein UY37_C0011G0011 [Candidatus Beckwithbacteria bacterium GW2011_GWC2_49_11]|nr:MAG: hypothetical protein UY37_C0011G0011 [Candidatus Beckwithbacteria bacterium GW2011_GWC2_49_11]
MPGTKQVLIDADALVGLINQSDALHSRSLRIVRFLAKNNLATIVLPSTILEAATALSRGIKRPDLAKELLADYSRLEPVELPSEIFSKLLKIYNPTETTKNTPFDYFLLAYARIKQIDFVFSFDRFYEKQGLTLAEKLCASDTP